MQVRFRIKVAEPFDEVRVNEVDFDRTHHKSNLQQNLTRLTITDGRIQAVQHICDQS